MAYDAVRVDDVYDFFIELAVPEPRGEDDSQCRARIDHQIIGLPVPERKPAKAEPQKSPAEVGWLEMDWLRNQ